MGRKPGTATICLVCGDKANGINFGVASCMSCKTFFRRNALRQKEMICQFSNACKVDRATRRCCTKCRLDKCFIVGMKKDLIQTDDEKQEMREKIRLNRIKRLTVESNETLNNQLNILQSEQSTFSQLISNPKLSFILLEPVSAFALSSSSNSTASTSPSSTFNTSPAQTSPDSTENLVPEYSGYKEQEYFQSNNNETNLESFELGPELERYCDELLNSQDNMSSIDLSDIEVIPLETNYQHETLPDQNQLALVSSNSGFITNYQQNQFADPILDFAPEFASLMPNYSHPSIDQLFGFPMHELILPEQNLLMELVSATTVLHNPYKRIETFKFHKAYSYECTEYIFYRLIRMSKQMHGFNQLSREGQGQVLKSSLVPMLCIRTVLMYNLYRKAWAFVNDRYKASMMFQTEIIKPFCQKISYERLEQFPLLFRDEWKDDQAIFGLLTAIVMFTPKVTYQEYDKVNTEHHRYIRLLHRYLQSKYSSKVEADDCFHQLMYNLKECELLSEDITYFLRCLKGKFQYSPFFTKLLDLNNLPVTIASILPPSDMPPQSFTNEDNFKQCHDLLNAMACWL